MGDVVTLVDVLDHLNIFSADSEAEIEAMLAAAEAAVITRVGPIVAEDRTDRVDGCKDSLLLPAAPIIEITSLSTSDGTTVDLSALTVDDEVGLIEYTAGGRFTARKYDVEYRAGWEEAPADLQLAIKELVRHLWATQRGGSSRPGSAVQEPQGPGYLMPNRVLELLQPYMVPRVA